jgi:hypothetical protein
MGVGWQDPAVIRETGLCVWRSGMTPVLDFKQNGDFLSGCMAVLWTGHSHDTPGVVDHPRDYERIAASGRIARDAARQASLRGLADGMSAFHQTQLDEGMEPLPAIAGAMAHKYCGGGYGGYALYLFDKSVLLNHSAGFETAHAHHPRHRLARSRHRLCRGRGLGH